MAFSPCQPLKYWPTTRKLNRSCPQRHAHSVTPTASRPQHHAHSITPTASCPQRHAQSIKISHNTHPPTRPSTQPENRSKHTSHLNNFYTYHQGIVVEASHVVSNALQFFFQVTNSMLNKDKNYIQ